MTFDIVVHGGTVITVNPDFDIIKDGLVCIKNDRIELVDPRPADLPFPEAKVLIDAKGGIIMPGLVNTHTHLPMTLFRGLADDLPLMTWLNKHIFPAEKTEINPASARLGALLACAEMIGAGTTICCDGYFFEDEVASAVSDSGMRGVLGQGVMDFPAPGVPDPSDNIRTALAFADKWQDACSTITPSIFCHSPYTCSADTLIKAKKAADSKGLLFQIHAAETKNELDQIKSEHHATPIAYLDRIGVLDKSTLLVHAIWIDENDIEKMARRDAKVSVTTESEMKLASGIAPIQALLKAGVTVSLGTDGCASNNDLDLFREMDFTAKLHKASALDPTVMDAQTVLRMATINGAKALGLDRDIGSLEPGKQADLIIIDTGKPHLVPMYNPVSHIVYAVSGSDVRDVVVAGKVILRDGEILTLDVEDIVERMVEWSSR